MTYIPSNSTHMQEVDLKILVVCLHYQFHHLFLVPKDDLLCTMVFFFKTKDDQQCRIAMLGQSRSL